MMLFALLFGLSMDYGVFLDRHASHGEAAECDGNSATCEEDRGRRDPWRCSAAQTGGIRAGAVRTRP
jgi:hypothetical protein